MSSVRPPGPTVSVVVVNWNSGPALRSMLASLSAQPLPPTWEAVVVDNASSDGSADLDDMAGVEVVHNPGNVGLAAANNLGMARTSGPYVLIANPDIELPPGALGALVGAMERHDRAAFVVPRLAGPDGSPQTSAGDLPSLAEALLGRRPGARRPGARRGAASGYWWHGWAHDREQPIGRGAEACYLVRRAAVDEIGPQDARYRLDWEGIDWTARARAAGWEVWLDPSTTVTHIGGVSVSQAPLRWVATSHLGMYRYFAGRGGRARRPLLAAVIALRALLKMAAVVAGVPMYRRAQRVGGRRPVPAR